ncbi:MAG: Slp family lipoprotein [Bacteroidetes bacterium]|nr:Slp family lipoprotein [Bacteroidota bacterium]
MRFSLIIYLLSGLMFTGCTTIISEQSRSIVNTDAAFKSVKQTPEKYVGKNIMLGGRIVNIKNSSEGAQIEIVQFDLNSRSYPEERFISYGRFLATDNNYMDPLIFKSGMLLTLVGEIKGQKTMRLDEMDYVYPVVAVKEWYLWPGSGPDSSCVYPVSSPQYNPYNYGFGSEPYFQRPFAPATGPR